MYFIKTICCMYIILIFAYLFNKSIIHSFPADSGFIGQEGKKICIRDTDKNINLIGVLTYPLRLKGHFYLPILQF